MTSSTSSSRKIFAKIFLVITLGMAVSMALVRLFTWLNGVSGEQFLGRVLEARAALPRIVAEPDPLVMFYGSSMTQAGFSARQFDREMAERGVRVKSFNFGFGGLNPYFQDFLARRVREAFEAEDRRLELALIELVPFQLTQTRWQGAEPLVDSYLGMLASPRELGEMLLDDPTRAIRVFNIRYLRDSVSAEMITFHFGQGLRLPEPTSDLPEDEQIQERMDELGQQLNERFEQDYPDYAGENWHYGWQGAGTIPEERSEETRELFRQYYDAIRNPRRMDGDRLWRIYSADIVELRFEELLVESFIRIVETFKQFSDRVEVVLLPRNAKWIQYTPEGAARLEALIERVSRETGVPIRNYQDHQAFGPEMFGDTTHLSRYAGDVTFTSLLVDQYAPLLGAPPSPGDALSESPSEPSSRPEDR